MKKFILITLFYLGAFFLGHSQSYKNIFAKSFLNKKAPELFIDQWISEKPKTEGKFVLIDFWATSCKPCLQLIPELNYFQRVFQDKLVVIGVTHEPIEKLSIYKERIDYYFGTDPHKRTYSTYEIRGIPYAVLIDPKGFVKWEGYPLLDTHRLTEEVIEKIIN